MTLIDIAANLTDPAFQGFYFGKQYHESDIDKVLERAAQNGVEKTIVTIGNVSDLQHALSIVRPHSNLYTTIGVHPLTVSELENDPQLLEVIDQTCATEPKIIAFGEIGLDFETERVKMSPKDIQMKWLKEQLKIASKYAYPLFLHSRDAVPILLDVVAPYIDGTISKLKGVVHSFTGSIADLELILKTDLYISINGASFRDATETVARIPIDRILFETDSPYCELKKSYDAYKFVASDALKTVDRKKYNGVDLVKGRNEPCNVKYMVEAYAGLTGQNVEDVIKQSYRNAVELYNFNE